MDKAKKQRIRELEREYFKLSRKRSQAYQKATKLFNRYKPRKKKLNAVMKKIVFKLSELKKNLINYPVEIKFQ